MSLRVSKIGITKTLRRKSFMKSNLEIKKYIFYYFMKQKIIIHQNRLFDYENLRTVSEYTSLPRFIYLYMNKSKYYKTY